MIYLLALSPELARVRQARKRILRALAALVREGS